MPTYEGQRALPPKSWDEFEAIVCSASQNRWRNPDFTLHGRQGQPQSGVDVYGDDLAGRLVGLQCKNTAALTRDTIKAEVEKAETFVPALYKFYVATTTDADVGLQEFARQLSAERRARGRFEVALLFWEDIWRDLARDEPALFLHYPQLKPSAQAENEPSHDQRLFQEFQSTFPYEPAVRLFRDHDFAWSFRRRDLQPLYDFIETWDQPEKEFLDDELQAALRALHLSARTLTNHFLEKTVPLDSDGSLASVVPDRVRASGVRPQHIVEEIRILNLEARAFVPIYERFLRLCRKKLVR